MTNATDHIFEIEFVFSDRDDGYNCADWFDAARKLSARPRMRRHAPKPKRSCATPIVDRTLTASSVPGISITLNHSEGFRRLSPQRVPCAPVGRCGVASTETKEQDHADRFRELERWRTDNALPKPIQSSAQTTSLCDFYRRLLLLRRKSASRRTRLLLRRCAEVQQQLYRRDRKRIAPYHFPSCQCSSIHG